MTDDLVGRQTDAEVAAKVLLASGTSGNGPGPRVSSLRVAQHLKQENAK